MAQISLSRKYTAGEKSFDTIELREPVYKEIYMGGRGKPQEVQPTPNGPVIMTYPEVIDSYLKILVVEPGYEYIGQLSAVDSLKLEQAVCGFFLDTPTLPKPPTS